MQNSNGARVNHRARSIGAVCMTAALLLTSCAPVPRADEATPAPTPPFSESTISITYVKDGEQRELVAHPTQPLCDWDRDITVLGEDPMVPNGVMLFLEDDGESIITGWVGDADFRRDVPERVKTASIGSSTGVNNPVNNLGSPLRTC